MPEQSVGLWMIGACGRVGSAVALGLAALRQGKIGPHGLVSELLAFDKAGLVPPDRIAVGGHEIRGESLLDAVRVARTQAGLFSEDLIDACTDELRAMQRNIRPGTARGLSPAVRAMMDGASGRSKKAASRRTIPRDQTPADAVERLADDIRAFKRRHWLDVVVVVNVASCESAARASIARATPSGLARTLSRTNAGLIPASVLYALAAVDAGCPYINFTPSSALLPAVRQTAERAGIPYMGNDGKTGETLVKSALAPLFALRNLRVLSWTGQNLLGNRDGEVLRDPGVRAAKVRTKDRVVSSIVPGKPTTLVSIEYVPSLDDWKVAWDHIHFEGFLGTKMAMQFTWQGCDSILAAPLVIDLVRFAALEVRRGAGGLMRHLAFFFKDPIDVHEHDLTGQWRRLVEHVCHNPVAKPPTGPTGRLVGSGSPARKRRPADTHRARSGGSRKRGAAP